MRVFFRMDRQSCQRSLALVWSSACFGVSLRRACLLFRVDLFTTSGWKCARQPSTQESLDQDTPYYLISPATENATFEHFAFCKSCRPSSVTNVAADLPLVRMRNRFSPCHWLRRITIPSFRNVYLIVPHTGHDILTSTPLAFMSRSNNVLHSAHRNSGPVYG